jgi:hypothetical protein
MNGSSNTSGAGSGGLASLLSNTTFLQGAFIVALILLIFAHKITIEGLVEA